MKPCPCGSNENSFILYDARGIPVGRVCRQCIDKVKSKYRPEVFEDTQYDTYGEAVDEPT